MAAKKKKNKGTAVVGEVRTRKNGHHFRKRKDGKWDRVEKQKGKWVVIKRKKNKTKSLLYGPSTHLLRIYDKRKESGSKLFKYFDALKKEKDTHGILFTESLDEEITLVRALIMESLEDYENLGDDIAEIGRRQWVRGDTVEMVQKLSQIMERAVNMKYNTRYSIKIEEVKVVINIFQQIITRNVSDKETMQKILRDIDKTLLDTPKEEKIVG